MSGSSSKLVPGDNVSSGSSSHDSEDGDHDSESESKKASEQHGSRSTRNGITRTDGNSDARTPDVADAGATLEGEQVRGESGDESVEIEGGDNVSEDNGD
ncbi:hypothetical protein QYF36_003470 [Acer negundo]|nr:hypothetical protein QYF36_003470 [Acer negundo]